MVRCPNCNGAGEIEHPAYHDLDRLWRAGWGWAMDEEFIADFWLNRGFDPDNPPPRFSLCAACGGTGSALDVYENLALEARALAAWREANPEGLIGRLIALHRRDRGLALALARYSECYSSAIYEGLAEDVAAWPVPQKEVK